MRICSLAALASAGLFVFAAETHGQSWHEASGPDASTPAFAYKLGGMDVMRLSCGANGTLRLSLYSPFIAVPPPSSGQKTTEVQIDTNGWLSPPIQLQLGGQNEMFVDMPSGDQIVSAFRFAQTVKVKQTKGGWTSEPVSLAGVGPYLLSLDSICPKSAVTETVIQPPAIAKQVVREYGAQDLAEAERRVARLDCPTGANVAYCIDPTILALRGEQIQAAAAAMSRMPPNTIVNQYLFGQIPQITQNIYACANDVPCLRDILSERIVFWDSLFSKFSQEQLSALPTPGPGFDCAAELHPVRQAICKSPALAERHRLMTEKVESLRSSTADTSLAEEVRQRIDGFRLEEQFLQQCPADENCLSQMYGYALDALDQLAAQVNISLQQIKDQEQQQQEREREVAEAAQQEREREAALKASRDAEKAASRREGMTDQAPHSIDNGRPSSGTSETVILLPPGDPSTFTGAPGFFEEDYKTGIFSRNGYEWVEKIDGRNLTRALRLDEFLALVDPAQVPKDRTREIWTQELYDHWRNGRSAFFDPALDAALYGVKSVYECHYDRYFNPDIPGSGGQMPWTVPTMFFWGEDVPETLSFEALRQRRNPNGLLHPLLIVGPKVDACPKTLGQGVELLASQLGDLLDPALIPAALGSTGGTDLTSMTDPRQELVRSLLGMSLAETDTAPDGQNYGRKFLIVDHIAPDGPAFAAGFRSGDYLYFMDWAQTGTIARFATELEKRQFNKAVVLSRLSGASFSDGDARLVVFSDEPETEFGHIPRSSPGEPATDSGMIKFTTNGYGVEVWLSAPEWCGEQVTGELRYPLEPQQGGGNADFAGVSEAVEEMRKACPQMQGAKLVFRSTLVDAAFQTYVADLTGAQPRYAREGLDGLPFASSVNEARKIAMEQAPLCDRLAAHSSDRNRRFGLEGNDFIAAENLEQAITACLDEWERRPDDPVLNFQLGRVLYEAGLAEDALPYFEIAVAADHGGAADYLGQMYLDGDGVPQDDDLSDTYFQLAARAGFSPFREEDEERPFDASGTTWTDQIISTYKMSIRMNPEAGDAAIDYSRDAEKYLYFMLEAFAQTCSSPAEIDRLQSGLSTTPDDPDMRHALHIYGTYLPTLLPTLKVKLGIAQTLEDWPSAFNSQMALAAHYPCESRELRQFVMNSAELIMR